jgi:hypothetical protein
MSAGLHVRKALYLPGGPPPPSRTASDSLTVSDTATRVVGRPRSAADTLTITDSSAGALTYESSGSAGTGTTGTITESAFPGGVAAGDLLVAMVIATTIDTNDIYQISDLSAGWTAIGAMQTSADGLWVGQAFYKVATGTTVSATFVPMWDLATPNAALYLLNLGSVNTYTFDSADAVLTTGSPVTDPTFSNVGVAGETAIVVAMAWNNFGSTGTVPNTPGGFTLGTSYSDALGTEIKGRTFYQNNISGPWSSTYDPGSSNGALMAVAFAATPPPAQAIAATTTKSRSATDSITITDSAVGSQSTGFVGLANDSLTTSDTAAATGTRARSAADTLTVTDTAARIVGRPRPATDSITVTDAATRTSARTRSAADSITLSDTASPASTRARTLSDTLTTTDSADGLPWRVRYYQPDSLFAVTNLTGTYLDIDDNPSSPDANALVPTGAGAVDVRIGFASHGQTLRTNAGDQILRVRVTA